MSSQRFAAWVMETKDLVAQGNVFPDDKRDRMYWILAKAVVYALLTIAIAIHEAAETKEKK